MKGQMDAAAVSLHYAPTMVKVCSFAGVSPSSALGFARRNSSVSFARHTGFSEPGRAGRGGGGRPEARRPVPGTSDKHNVF